MIYTWLLLISRTKHQHTDLMIRLSIETKKSNTHCHPNTCSIKNEIKLLNIQHFSFILRCKLVGSLLAVQQRFDFLFHRALLKQPNICVWSFSLFISRTSLAVNLHFYLDRARIVFISLLGPEWFLRIKIYKKNHLSQCFRALFSVAHRGFKTFLLIVLQTKTQLGSSLSTLSVCFFLLWWNKIKESGKRIKEKTEL